MYLDYIQSCGVKQFRQSLFQLERNIHNFNYIHMHYSSPFFWSPSVNPVFCQTINQYFDPYGINNFVFYQNPQNCYQNSMIKPHLLPQKQRIISLNQHISCQKNQSQSVFQENTQKNKNCSKRIQNKGRNDYSNMLKVFFHQFKDNKNIKHNVSKIVIGKKMDLNVNQFLVKIKRRFIKGKTYVSPKQIIKYLNSGQSNSQNGQADAIQVFKSLLYKFLKQEYFLWLMKTFKGQRQNKINLIRKRRQLYSILFRNQQEV